jgi:3-deoxy-manno-octulosonate cytidylyltransferase (CMP-KDO synthetase)
MTAIAVIPARFGSTRFHAKALAKETGKYLVQHVYERASGSVRLDQVVVATDDERIMTAVKSFGGRVMMTRADHESGTDRVAEAASSLHLADEDLVLNVQGDEPEINPETIDSLVDFMAGAGGAFPIGTAAVPFADDGPREGVGSPLDANCVKVVLGRNSEALYFSRSLIPYPRDTNGQIDQPSRWLLHLGLYAFRAQTLRELTQKPPAHDRVMDQDRSRNAPTAAGTGRMLALPAQLARTESLEQLRWLASGLAIGVVIGKHASMGIDTPEQYAAFVRRTREPAGSRTE